MTLKKFSLTVSLVAFLLTSPLVVHQLLSTNNKFTHLTAAASTVKKITIGSRDTLWSLARDNRTSNNITIKQAMLAIKDANPHAFPSNNINEMTPNSTLTIPTAAEMRRRTAVQAALEVTQQNQAWEAAKNSATPLVKQPVTPPPVIEPITLPSQFPDTPESETQASTNNKELIERLMSLEKENTDLANSLKQAETEKSDLQQLIDEQLKQVEAEKSDLQKLIDEQLKQAEAKKPDLQTETNDLTTNRPSLANPTANQFPASLIDKAKSNPILYGGYAAAAFFALVFFLTWLAARRKAKKLAKQLAEHKKATENEPTTASFTEMLATPKVIEHEAEAVSNSQAHLAAGAGFAATLTAANQADAEAIVDFTQPTEEDAEEVDLTLEKNNSQINSDNTPASFDFNSAETGLDTEENYQTEAEPVTEVDNAPFNFEFNPAEAELDEEENYQTEDEPATEADNAPFNFEFNPAEAELDEEENYQTEGEPDAEVDNAPFNFEFNPAEAELETEEDDNYQQKVDFTDFNPLADLSGLDEDYTNKLSSLEAELAELEKLHAVESAELDIDNELAELEDDLANEYAEAIKLTENLELDDEELANLADLATLEAPLDAAEFEETELAADDFAEVTYDTAAADILDTLESLEKLNTRELEQEEIELTENLELGDVELAELDELATLEVPLDTETAEATNFNQTADSQITAENFAEAANEQANHFLDYLEKKNQAEPEQELIEAIEAEEVTETEASEEINPDELNELEQSLASEYAEAIDLTESLELENEQPEYLETPAETEAQEAELELNENPEPESEELTELDGLDAEETDFNQIENSELAAEEEALEEADISELEQNLANEYAEAIDLTESLELENEQPEHLETPAETEAQEAELELNENPEPESEELTELDELDAEETDFNQIENSELAAEETEEETLEEADISELEKSLASEYAEAIDLTESLELENEQPEHLETPAETEAQEAELELNENPEPESEELTELDELDAEETDFNQIENSELAAEEETLEEADISELEKSLASEYAEAIDLTESLELENEQPEHLETPAETEAQEAELELNENPEPESEELTELDELDAEETDFNQIENSELAAEETEEETLEEADINELEQNLANEYAEAIDLTESLELENEQPEHLETPAETEPQEAELELNENPDPESEELTELDELDAEEESFNSEAPLDTEKNETEHPSETPYDAADNDFLEMLDNLENSLPEDESSEFNELEQNLAAEYEANDGQFTFPADEENELSELEQSLAAELEQQEAAKARAKLNPLEANIHTDLGLEAEQIQDSSSLEQPEKDADDEELNINPYNEAGEIDPLIANAISQLDLATVYLEMGDKGGAQELLDRLADSTNPEIKNRAQQLLAKL